MSSAHPFDLTDRVAVVTGASSGIGQATAIALARAGADVAGLSLDEAPDTATAIEALGRRSLQLVGDVSDRHCVDEVAERVDSELGPIAIWVNNAGRMLVRPFAETTEADWRALLDVNLLGYVWGCGAAGRAMASTGGSIVNVSSAADVQPLANLSAYITAKGGIVGLTKVLAVELAPQGIRVNAIAPGATDTPLNEKAYTPAVRARYEERIPLGRIGSAAEIADAAVFLASDAARYVTGHELLVDGGLTLEGSVGHAES